MFEYDDFSFNSVHFLLIAILYILASMHDSNGFGNLDRLVTVFFVLVAFLVNANDNRKKRKAEVVK